MPKYDKAQGLPKILRDLAYDKIINGEVKNQKDIAEAVGVSAAAMTRYLNGDTGLSTDTLSKFANYFGVSSDYLLGNESEKPSDIIVKRLAEIKGEMSTEKFAEKIGCSRQSVNYWINGERSPSAENIIAISKAFDVSADYLLGIEGIDIKKQIEKAEKRGYRNGLKLASDALYDMHIRFEQIHRGGKA